MLSSRWMNGAAALAVLAVMAPQAFAQSTGTQEVEKVVVTGTRAGTGGLIVKEKATKTRSTIDEKYTASQPAGQSVAQNLNLLPGVNFTNSDPYGSSGGNIRIRGFDGARISLTQDGIPLNDTGNYAIFTNQLIDGEYLQRATVNTGTTDVDSPTASATGGTINTVTRRPFETMTLSLGAAAGSFNYNRFIGIFDTGEYNGTSAFAGLSFQEYDKFKGPGDLQKTQTNARIYKKIGDNSFVSVIAHYNENRNNFYRNLTKAQIAAFGDGYDNFASCTRDTANGIAGVDGLVDNIQNDGIATLAGGTENILNPGSCTNFFNIRINPSNTGNVRLQGNFDLGDGLRLTIDPSWQYVKANGGGTSTIGENDGRLRGTTLLTAFDMNGDGDTVDTGIRFYSPNNTNTSRYGVTTSLIWDIDDENKVRVAYTGDFGRHRQTGAWSRIFTDGNTLDIFGGLDNPSARVLTADGNFIRGRDRLSYADLNQLALSYSGRFFEDTLRIDVGLRAPVFDRELNNFCFTQVTTGGAPASGASVGSSTVRCTTENFNDAAIGAANDGIGQLVTGSGTIASGIFARPFNTTFTYDAILPNVGISWEFAENHIVYGSFAEGLSAPRTDNLYFVIATRTGPLATDPYVTSFPGVEPERTKSFDLGYRFQGEWATASMALWKNTFENRIVSSFDQTLGVNVDRNVGTVELEGVDVEVGLRPAEGLTAYASASYNQSELQDDLNLGRAADLSLNILPLKGKSLVETPEWTFAGRVQYQLENFTFGLQGKYVGDRFSTDMNDEVAEAYTIFDANVVADLAGYGLGDTELQLNAINLFDENYLGNISSTNHALNLADVNPGPLVVPRSGAAPNYSIGAPQTFQLQLRTKF